MTDQTMTPEQALEWLEGLRNTTGDQVCADIEAGKAAEAAQAFCAALEAAREDARKWRYLANGPQGTFLTDDLELAAAILAAYDKDDDWTVTDIVDPAEATIAQQQGGAS